MNHQLWGAVAARVLALSFVIAGLTACGERLSDVSARTPKATPADASAVVIGTAPGQPSGDPPGTTPVAQDTSEVSKGVEAAAMPLPGQPNDHSNPGNEGSQKVEQKDGPLKTGEPPKSGSQS
jgi:hypothetical protein